MFWTLGCQALQILVTALREQGDTKGLSQNKDTLLSPSQTEKSSFAYSFKYIPPHPPHTHINICTFVVGSFFHLVSSVYVSITIIIEKKNAAMTAFLAALLSQQLFAIVVRKIQFTEIWEAHLRTKRNRQHSQTLHNLPLHLLHVS